MYMFTSNLYINTKNEGLDRELETTVQVGSSEDVSSCWLLVKEVIPPGAYVDPNQLAFLRPLGGPGFHVPQVSSAILYIAEVTME